MLADEQPCDSNPNHPPSRMSLKAGDSDSIPLCTFCIRERLVDFHATGESYVVSNLRAVLR